MMEPRRTSQTTITEYALLVPRMGKLIARLARDPRVPARNKATLLLTAGYLVAPIDLVPARLFPGIGRLDDLLIAALALDQLLSDVPQSVLREHWEGSDDTLELVREVLRLATSFVPVQARRLFSSR